MLHVPIEEVQLRQGQVATPAEQDSPASRLLLAHLRACIEIGDGLGIAARNATLELFRGLLADQVIDDEPLYSALVGAALECIDKHLLTATDLTPAVIAQELHVSVRTLHRAFAAEEKSVMGCVRERRLARVKTELATTSWTVSELAARWHFSSESHLIRLSGSVSVRPRPPGGYVHGSQVSPWRDESRPAVRSDVRWSLR